ncbi:MAG: BamA/TamA family outer membrane protein [Pseudomonadota bacterium]|nr:BamA/TamA family outer membrane protein [Pseudomonadota bacterium]
MLPSFGASPVAAQTNSTDSRLKELIPDSAVADPQAWARNALPAQTATPTPAPAPAPNASGTELRPDSPMTDLPGGTLAWPDSELALPALPSLEPEPDLASLLPPAAGVPQPVTAQLAGPPGAASAPRLLGMDPTNRPAVPDLHDAFAGGRLRLDYAVDAAAFPERAAFEARFRSLSAVATLPSRDVGNVGQLAVRAVSDRDLLLRLLRNYGYYDGEVIQTVSRLARDNVPAILSAAPASAVNVSFEIVPGPRYSFAAIDLGQLPETGSDYPALRKSLAIETGDPLHADAIVAGRAALDTALGETGYPFAQLGDASLLIDHQRQAGDLTLPVIPGGKYRFAGITSTNPHFLSASHLARIARFKPGQTWQRSKVEDLREAILATGLVASVTVTPKETTKPQPGEPGDAMLDVAMTKARQHTVSAAIGYDTAAGFRLETSWENRNQFPPEGLLRLRGVAGTQEQLAGVTFRRNNFDGRDRALTIDLYAQNANLTAYAARKLDFVATYERLTTLLFQKPWVWSVGVEAVASAEREGMPNGTVLGNSDAGTVNYSLPRTNYITTALPLRVAYDGSDSLLDPQRGWRAALRVSPELSLGRGHSSPYVTSQLDVSAYQPVAAGTVIAERVRLASIFGTDLENIAPSRRLYAGGGASIRGFGYDLVGPRNALGELTGGRSLYEFSIEARLHTGLFGGAMSLVPFFDTGGVGTGSSPDFRDRRMGAGLGVRYNTGFGPLRIDVGTPLDPHPGESRVGVYIALGQAF